MQRSLAACLAGSTEAVAEQALASPAKDNLLVLSRDEGMNPGVP